MAPKRFSPPRMCYSRLPMSSRPGFAISFSGKKSPATPYRVGFAETKGKGFESSTCCLRPDLGLLADCRFNVTLTTGSWVRGLLVIRLTDEQTLRQFYLLVRPAGLAGESSSKATNECGPIETVDTAPGRPRAASPLLWPARWRSGSPSSESATGCTRTTRLPR